MGCIRSAEHLVYTVSLVLEIIMIIYEGEWAGETERVGESNYEGVVNVRSTSSNAR